MSLIKKNSVIAAIIFVFGITLVDCAVAGTKTMNFELVSMIEKIETVKGNKTLRGLK